MTGTDRSPEEKAQLREYLDEAWGLFADISTEFGEEVARRIFLHVANWKPKRKRGQRGPGKNPAARPSKDALRKRKARDPLPSAAWELVSQNPPDKK